MEDLEWRWTDLMPGDKVKYTKEGAKYFGWNIDIGTITIKKVEINEDEEGSYIIFIYQDKKGSKRSAWMNLDGTRKGIQLFKLISLAKD